jgi:hypothetical protein
MSEDNSTSLLTKPEKEKKVIGLLKQGKTFIQIAREVHVSFGDIDRIKKELIGEQEDGKSEQSSNNANKKIKSIDAQAFLLFSKGKSRVKVAIELDLPTNEVERLSKDYWLLNGLDELPVIYSSIKKDLPSIFKLYHLTKDKNIKNQDILKLLKKADRITILEKEAKNLDKQVDDIVFERGDKLGELQSLMNRIAGSNQQLSEIENEILNRTSDLQWLRYEICEKRKEL